MMPVTIADLMEQREAGQAPEHYSLPVSMSTNNDPRSEEYHDNAKYMADQLRASPEGQEILAHQLATKLLQKYGGDQERAAYAWTMGPNRKISSEDLNNPSSAGGDYVAKFRKNIQKENPDVPQLQEESRSKVKKSKKWKSLGDKKLP
jgi:hypothetical protein